MLKEVWEGMNCVLSIRSWSRVVSCKRDNKPPDELGHWKVRVSFFAIYTYIHSNEIHSVVALIKYLLVLRCRLYMFRTVTVHPLELLCRYCMCRLWYVLRDALPDTSSWYQLDMIHGPSNVKWKKLSTVLIFKAQECRVGRVSSTVCRNNRIFLLNIFFFPVVAVWVFIGNVQGSLSPVHYRALIHYEKYDQQVHIQICTFIAV